VGYESYLGKTLLLRTSTHALWFDPENQRKELIVETRGKSQKAFK
jgi:hypothetical protein